MSRLPAPSRLRRLCLAGCIVLWPLPIILRILLVRLLTGTGPNPSDGAQAIATYTTLPAAALPLLLGLDIGDSCLMLFAFLGMAQLALPGSP